MSRHSSRPVGTDVDKANKLAEASRGPDLDLLGESFKAFSGAGYDLRSLLDSASKINPDANAI